MVSTPGASAGLASPDGGEPVSDRSGDIKPSEADVGLSDLYRLYSGWLASRLRRRFGDETDDLVQEAYLRIARYSRQGAILHPKALLLRIATNLGSDRDGQSRRRARHAKLQSQTSGWGAEPASQMDDVLTRQIILGLPQPLRDVFLLSRFGGLTNSQIAERLGISPKTVEWRMTRALAHCTAQLRR